MPALLKRTSRRPNFPLVEAKSACTAFCSVTSVGATRARSPAFDIFAVSSSRSLRRPASATPYPSFRNASATERPMPLPAPVTIATFPDEAMFPPVKMGSAHRGELPRLLHARADALQRGRGAPARVLDRLVGEQRHPELRHQLLSRGGVSGEQPVERLRGDAVVEVVHLQSVLHADRLVDPGP